jgi:hypothetical protein
MPEQWMAAQSDVGRMVCWNRGEGVRLGGSSQFFS